MAELILALDLPTRSDALHLLDRLPALRWVKVGSILMTAEGPGLVRELVARGLHVFLDLKWHDIPSTVAGAVRVAAGLGVSMATVHASGGSEMLQAAVGAAPASLALVGVTVLTSHLQPQSTDFTDSSVSSSSDESVESVDASLKEQVARLARLATEAGLRGVVCSPLEVARVRAMLAADALIVVPGIRRAGDDPGDQRRTASPAEAIRGGATHLVVGRPVVQAPDPAAALEAFLAEIS
jgi:orotidine-5'-phosphate decarboxylase